MMAQVDVAFKGLFATSHDSATRHPLPSTSARGHPALEQAVPAREVAGDGGRSKMTDKRGASRPAWLAKEAALREVARTCREGVLDARDFSPRCLASERHNAEEFHKS